MGKALIIAEKPSVANDIARALGGFTRHGDYFESDEYVVSSAVGHLVEIAAPEEYEVKRGKWSFANLPVIPPHFDLRPIERTEDRLKLLTRLIKRKDVDRADQRLRRGPRRRADLPADRPACQGQAADRAPVAAVDDAGGDPRRLRAAAQPTSEMMPLADAARCRSEADWLVGINGTRAMTAFNSRDGGFYLTTVGRVQTPTLAVVVEREEKIRKFVPRDYFEVRATFGARPATTTASGSTANSRRARTRKHRADRLWDRAKAEAIVADCEGRDGTVVDEAKPATQLAPALFDLTTPAARGQRPLRLLGQDHAVDRPGAVRTAQGADLSADRLARAARGLPADGDGRRLQRLDGSASSMRRSPGRSSSKDWVKPEQADLRQRQGLGPLRDHPDPAAAEEPVRCRAEDLRPGGAPLPGRVLSRGRVPGHHPHHHGRRAHVQDRRQGAGQPGLAGHLRQGGHSARATARTWCRWTQDERVPAEEIATVALQTRPPARYTEATLLSAMEGAGKTDR